MGVIYSIPLCSRDNGGGGDAKGAQAQDHNNNEPMPSMHPGPAAVIVQQPQEASARENRIDHFVVDAASAPAGGRNYSDSLGSSAGLDDLGLGSDSGLEHSSSSDELELSGHGSRAGQRPRSVAERHVSIDDHMEEEGHFEIPLDNDDYADDEYDHHDDDDDDHDDDPIERPPEPTVPDERIDSTSSEDSRESPQRNPRPAPDLLMQHKRGEDTASAISDLLSEIVGDHPYNDAALRKNVATLR
jgi:hypothetical protein